MAPVQPSSLASLNLVGARSQVVGALGGLTVSPEGTWLSTSNPYLVGGSKRVVDDFKAGSVAYNEVTEYVAASAFLHCADAWSYVGRAVDALLKGDPHAAVHLAYYAELRAAKSLLAAEGVFVGNGYSFALDGNATLTTVSREPTHRAAWELIDEWFKQAGAVATVARIVAPGGQALRAWIGAIPGGVNAVMQDMLSGLAFDLCSFAEDRERRNLASYEPTTLTAPTLGVDTIRRTLSGLWAELEPMTGGDFPGIDRAILANVLFRQYSAQNLSPDEDDPSMERVDWDGWEDWIDALTPAALNPSALRDVLRSDPSGPAFQAILGDSFADTSEMNDAADFIRPMISRATVLTRIATGLCLGVLDDAGKGVGDLSAWTAAFAVSRGHVGAAPLAEPATDLFTDLDLPREALESSQAANLNALVTELAEGVGLLGQVDRVVAWSFA